MGHYNFGIDMFSRMDPVVKLDLIITDEEMGAEKIDVIRAKGVEVIVIRNQE
ncbi:hypothetical protein ACQKM9_18035 [Viridibacillus sp. NPDC093762]|uniref:hypothetical protein n=1 Tax=Viridibacillus sp. NPDC093762 TaxID=3390720 RepID=UPI003CFDE1B5